MNSFHGSNMLGSFERMVKSGVEIVRPIAKSEQYGISSFFVRGPDKLLVEIVQEKPIPEGIWKKDL